MIRYRRALGWSPAGPGGRWPISLAISDPSGRLPKFPHPPAADTLVGVVPDLHRLPIGTILWRVYFRGGLHPGRWDLFRNFGPTTARFDHQLADPDGRPQVQDLAIQYAALDGITPLAEMFQDTRVIDRQARRPWLVAYALTAELTLLDLTGAYPTRVGASMAINCGSRPRARAWSRVFHAAYPQVQGLYYGSCLHANCPSLALYERAQGAVPASPLLHRSLSDAALKLTLRNAATQIGFMLI